jgi:sec-independent protein translocase protein TatA
MVILIIVLVLFGAKKVPELFRGMAQGVNEFKKAREEFEREMHTAGNDIKQAANVQPYSALSAGQKRRPTLPAFAELSTAAGGSQWTADGRERSGLSDGADSAAAATAERAASAGQT